MKRYNFNAGPSVLPREVLQESADAVVDFDHLGLSILELSHRSSWFGDVIEEARATVKELMQLGDDYEVLFLQGGGSTQFMQVPFNLLGEKGVAAYIDNGIWGHKAIEEARYFGKVDVVSSTEEKKNVYIEKTFSVPADASYLHFTANNTVEGTEWFSLPPSNGVPLVADMSSDIFSRELDFRKFSLIYAGAQKNLGTAGTTIVVVKKDILGKTGRPIPKIMDYQAHIKAKSLLNTPPVFAVYVSLLTMRWIKKQGGLKEMEKRAIARSSRFYHVLDTVPLYHPFVVPEDRSRMNATFDIAGDALRQEFLQLCDANGIVGIKGHRSKGGLRVSMYNALTEEDLGVLISLMEDFAQKKG